MAEQEKPRTRRRRRWPLLLLALAVIAIPVGLALRHYVQPQQVTALLIQQTRGALGVELGIKGNAGIGLWPRLHVLLPDPSLQTGGATTAFARAQSLEAVLPWSTLWGDRLVIERINLIRPTLDLNALSDWLATRPPSTSAPPDVRFTLHVEDATVMAGRQVIAQGLNMDFSNQGDLMAWLERATAAPTAASLPPLRGRASAAMLKLGETQLEGVEIELGDKASPAPQP